MLRRVHGTVGEQGMWRIRTDQELGELYKELEIAAYVKKKRLEWIGHVVRMDQGRVNKREVEEGEDMERDGWKMWRRICRR
jgi:hypothetical protein